MASRRRRWWWFALVPVIAAIAILGLPSSLYAGGLAGGSLALGRVRPRDGAHEVRDWTRLALLAAAVGAGLVAILQTLLRVAGGASPSWVAARERGLGDLRAWLADTLSLSPLSVALVAVACVGLSIAWPSLRPFRQLARLQRGCLLALLALTVATSFTFFNGERAGRVEAAWMDEHRPQATDAIARLDLARHRLLALARFEDAASSLTPTTRADLGEVLHGAPDGAAAAVRARVLSAADQAYPAPSSGMPRRDDDRPRDASEQRVRAWLGGGDHARPGDLEHVLATAEATTDAAERAYRSAQAEVASSFGIDTTAATELIDRFLVRDASDLAPPAEVRDLDEARAAIRRSGDVALRWEPAIRPSTIAASAPSRDAIAQLVLQEEVAEVADRIAASRRAMLRLAVADHAIAALDAARRGQLHDVLVFEGGAPRPAAGEGMRITPDLAAPSQPATKTIDLGEVARTKAASPPRVVDANPTRRPPDHAHPDPAAYARSEALFQIADHLRKTGDSIAVGDSPGAARLRGWRARSMRLTASDYDDAVRLAAAEAARLADARALLAKAWGDDLAVDPATAAALIAQVEGPREPSLWDDRGWDFSEVKDPHAEAFLVGGSDAWLGADSLASAQAIAKQIAPAALADSLTMPDVSAMETDAIDAIDAHDALDADLKRIHDHATVPDFDHGYDWVNEAKKAEQERDEVERETSAERGFEFAP